MSENNTVMIINWENISNFLTLPIEYRFVDYAEIEKKQGTGYKAVSSQDWYFKMHFPGNPLVPGMLLIEAMQQVGNLIIASQYDNTHNRMYLYEISELRMYGSVRPGDYMLIDVALDEYDVSSNIAKFHGEIAVRSFEGSDRVKICKMTFSLMRENEFISLKKETIASNSFLSEIGDARSFDFNNMSEYTAIPFDYCFADKVTVVGDEAYGKKYASSQDWYFKLINPLKPVMPEALLIECIMQTAVYIITTKNDIKDGLLLFHAIESLQMAGRVHPSDVINTHVRLISFKRGIAKIKGYCYVNERKICDVVFKIVAPNLLLKVSKEK